MATALAISACGGSESDSDDQPVDTGAENDGDPADTVDVTVQPDGATNSTAVPDTGGDSSASGAFDEDATFTQVVSTYPATLSPHLNPFQGQAEAFFVALHDRLLYVDPLTGELGPMLATAWEVDPDSSSITFTLRDDVTFHDGAPFTAESVVANVDHALSMGAEHTYAGLYEMVSGAEAVDEYTVRYDFTGSFAGGLLEMFAGGLGMFLSPETLGNDDPTQVVGTGPFEIGSVRAGSSYEFPAYDAYWNPDAQNFAQLDIVVVESGDTALNGIATGEYDTAILDWSLKARVDELDTVQSETAAGTGTMLLTINTEVMEGGNDPAVRLAINTAIDRQALAEGALRGGCVATVQPWNESLPGHNPDYPADYYGSDPQRAREILTEAGFPDGISIDLNTYTIPLYVPIAEVLQSQLAEAGIDATINQLESSTLISGFATDKSLDTWLSRFPFGGPPARLFPLWWFPGGGPNPGGWHDETIDEIYPEFMSEPDAAEQAALLQQVSARLVEAPAAQIFLCHEMQLWVAGEDVVGLQPLTFGYDYSRLGIQGS